MCGREGKTIPQSNLESDDFYKRSSADRVTLDLYKKIILDQKVMKSKQTTNKSYPFYPGMWEQADAQSNYDNYNAIRCLKDRIEKLEFLVWWVTNGGMNSDEMEVLYKAAEHIEKTNPLVQEMKKRMNAKPK
jgi:hypothetical protein